MPITNQPQNLGEILRYLKNCQGFTQQQIADYLSIDRSTYTYCETGKTIPSLKTLLCLSELFKVPITDFVDSIIVKPCLYHDPLDKQKRIVEAWAIKTIRQMDKDTFFSLNSYIDSSPYAKFKEQMFLLNPVAKYPSVFTTFSKILRLKRIQAGLRQDDIADFLKICRSNYTYMELGRLSPTLYQTYLLSYILKYPFLSFLHEQIGEVYCSYSEDDMSVRRHWTEKVILTSIYYMSSKQLVEFFDSFQARYGKADPFQFPHTCQRL